MAENYVGNYDESTVLPRYLLKNDVQFFTADEGRAITVYIRALKASGSSEDSITTGTSPRARDEKARGGTRSMPAGCRTSARLSPSWACVRTRPGYICSMDAAAPP